MKSENRLTLYQREACPYCQVVRKKLSLLGQPFVSIPVVAEGENRKELIELTGQQQVPVLVDGDNIVNGSQNILTYLDKTFGDGESKAMPSNSYGFHVSVKRPFEQVVEETVAALQTEGFGVLTEINVKATLKKKIDVDVPQQMILGACNPGFAHQAMNAEPDIGLLLPCNVTVRETGDEVTVTAVNPLKLLAVVGRDDLLPVAMEVKEKLANVIAKIEN
ncbi:MAG: DUF302 domain-containing protein [Deltaproteobacteria bacterium]|jgi:uncharacterized protein (DUF302 family)/glutaredoxin|nr:DUF302 domain-containing protein [Deltaproteobacteria bacterium]MBT4266702.1 DUF302 domain-containing protein [Deltaproteobacteria bacterium]MBT4641161.1 DUF302 domain-containing protein [Deltaproteobacteria bacterium]MBT6615783.1 DUF302 domain-containing protein [Deltaproteobacteria bacterium]MBT7153940.1 DUF302 domain-containing protein [Deltaproteobacteria bacterium]